MRTSTGQTPDRGPGQSCLWPRSSLWSCTTWPPWPWPPWCPCHWGSLAWPPPGSCGTGRRCPGCALGSHWGTSPRTWSHCVLNNSISSILWLSRVIASHSPTLPIVQAQVSGWVALDNNKHEYYLDLDTFVARVSVDCHVLEDMMMTSEAVSWVTFTPTWSKIVSF